MAISEIYPGKVVIGTPVASGYITIDQGTDHIIGLSQAGFNGAKGLARLLSKIYPGVSGLPVIGKGIYLNIEEVLRLKPDAVFINPGSGDIWRRAGFTGVTDLNVGGSSRVEKEARVWLEMGRIAGKIDRAKTLLEKARAKIDEFRASLSPLPRSKKARVISLQYVSSGYWIANGRNQNFNLKLEDAGGVSIAGRFTARLNVEELFHEDPDVILLLNDLSEPEANNDHAAFLHEPMFRALYAVKAEQVYSTPSYSFRNEPAEDPLLLDWLAEIFHPDLMPCRFREMFRQSYQNIYNYAIADAEIDAAIRLAENDQSAGYERFWAGADRTGICLRKTSKER